MLEDGHATVTTVSKQVTFNLRKQQGKRWVIDPQTFGSGGASAVAASLRREAGGNTQIAAALNSKSPDQLLEVLPREVARRAADLVAADDPQAGNLIDRLLNAAPSAAGAAAAPAAGRD
jgi:ATP-dependent exoDNAse (exonuclease V) alpha subunit